jgi:hypothetical protein
MISQEPISRPAGLDEKGHRFSWVPAGSAYPGVDPRDIDPKTNAPFIWVQNKMTAARLDHEAAARKVKKTRSKSMSSIGSISDDSSDQDESSILDFSLGGEFACELSSVCSSQLLSHLLISDVFNARQVLKFRTRKVPQNLRAEFVRLKADLSANEGSLDIYLFTRKYSSICFSAFNLTALVNFEKRIKFNKNFSFSEFKNLWSSTNEIIRGFPDLLLVLGHSLESEKERNLSLLAETQRAHAIGDANYKYILYCTTKSLVDFKQNFESSLTRNLQLYREPVSQSSRIITNNNSGFRGRGGGAPPGGGRAGPYNNNKRPIGARAGGSSRNNGGRFRPNQSGSSFPGANGNFNSASRPNNVSNNSGPASGRMNSDSQNP